MKSPQARVIVVLLASVFLGPLLRAQGTFNFTNAKGPKPQVFYQDVPLAGASYRINVLIFNEQDQKFWYGQKGGAAFEWTSFYSGANAGLFSGGTITVPFVEPGKPAKLWIRAWDVTTGGTFETATVKGEVTITIPALGGLRDPVTGLPGPPAQIVPPFVGFSLAGPPSGDVVTEVSARIVRIASDWYLTCPADLPGLPPWPGPFPTYALGHFIAYSEDPVDLALNPQPLLDSSMNFMGVFAGYPFLDSGTYYWRLDASRLSKGFFRTYVVHCYGCI